MKIIICDDTKADAAYLLECLNRYFTEEAQELLVCSDGKELLRDRRYAGFDLLFLDVYMPESNGIHVGRSLRERGEKGQIVLITTGREFGPESYEIGASWYLVKPFRYEEFVWAMKRCMQQQEKEAVLRIQVKKEQLEVPASQIDYIETEGRRVLIHMGSRELKVYDTLERLYGQLPDMEFIRPHRSYILRMSYIERLDGEQFLLKNGERVSINRHQRKEIRDAYHRWLFRALSRAGDAEKGEERDE